LKYLKLDMEPFLKAKQQKLNLITS
jgi:hypothetical protein